MVNFDWNNIVSFSPDATEQDKEDFYDALLLYEMETDLSNLQIHALFKVTQEILKFKGEQVESLLGEIDNLAARQGEDEAQKQQNLIDEIDTLQSKLAQTTRMESFTGSNLDEIRQDLVKIELRNEQLLVELQAKERDLISEKREVEKFASQVITLEREKGELRSELAALQRESVEQQESRIQTESADVSVEKHRELIESLRLKNQHINQLLTDIEGLEKENNILKINLGNIRDELRNATEYITKLTGERTNLNHSLHEQQERLTLIEEQNDGLRKQVIEMVADKNNKDEQLDHLSIALDSRLSQWQELLIQKDSELMETKKCLAELSARNHNIFLDSTKADIINITQTLERREQQIEDLEKQLALAMEEVKRNTSLMCRYKARAKAKIAKNGESSVVKQLKQELLNVQDRLKLLQDKVKDAEEDARAKAAEMTEMVIQLREYETGVYGLSEAVEKIKALQKQKNVRDKHIEQLIQAGNQLQEDANHLEEENLSLRAQLGIDVDTVVRVDGILAQHKTNQLRLAEVTQQLEDTQEVQIHLRLENRNLNKKLIRLKNQIQQLGFVPEVISSDEEIEQKQVLRKGFEIPEETRVLLLKEAEELESKLQDLIDENEALRKGMHEILESIRSQDGSSTVHIESICLERLLEALDSRHISGWYHPAMRLQAQLHTLEGSNTTLREQLHQSRLQTSEMTKQLETSLINVEQLKSDLVLLQSTYSQTKSFEQVDLLDKPLENVDVISKPKTEESRKPDEEYLKLASTLNEIQETMVENKELYDTDRESWQNVRSGLQQEIDSLRETLAISSAQIVEFKKQWEDIEKDPDVLKHTIAENTLRMAAMAGENEKLKRKCEVLFEIETKLKINCDNLKDELRILENSAEQKEGELTRERLKLLAELRLAESMLQEYVPISETEEVTRQFNQMTVKYRELVDKQLILDSSKEDLRSEIKTLESQLGEIKMSYSEFIKGHTSSTVEISDTTKQQFLDIAKQNIEHAEKMNQLMKDQLSVSEGRCKQLEKDMAAMIQHNLSAQLIEAELRDQLVESIPYVEVVQLKSKLANTEKQMSELRAEKLKLQEQIDIAQKQVEAWEQMRHEHDFQHDSLQRQVLELTAASEDKATIGRLSKELMRAQESEHTLSREFSILQDKLQKMDSLKISFESQVKTLEEQLNTSSQQHLTKCRSLIYIIHELHQRYLGCLPLTTAESLANVLLYCRLENQHTQEFISSQFNRDQILNLIQTKMDADGVKTMKRLEELKLDMRVGILESQLLQKQGQLERQDKLIASLQQEFINQDQIWEKKQLLWEQSMLEQYRLNEDITEDVKSIQSKDDQKETEPQAIPLENAVSMTEDHNVTPQPDNGSNEVVALTEQLNQIKAIMNEQSVALTLKENEITEMKVSISRLKEQLLDKERELGELSASLPEKQQEILENETTEILALKATVTSLQNIVNQKEETIGRYQTLLKECREEHSSTVLNLQHELSSLQEMLDNQEQTVSKMKSEESVEKGPAIKVILNKYLTRVHHLEDEAAQLRDQVSHLIADLGVSREQAEKWAHISEERLKAIQELKQRLDNAGDSTQLTEKCAEIDGLNQTISQLKARLETRDTLSTSRERLHTELERCKKRLEISDIQLTENKSEIQRLHQQLTIRTRSTPKPETISSAREETLQKQIRSLEQQVAELQQREEKERQFRKNKCSEEFEKWEIRKRWQSSNEKLRSQIQEKSSQVEALRANVERLKETIVRLERERNSLETKLKSAKGTAVTQSLVEELEKDRTRLQEELKAVRKSSELVAGSSSLSQVVEAQERRIAALVLAQKGDSALIEELEKLQERKSQLQKSNLRLEAENLELKLILERCRSSEFSPRGSLELIPETDGSEKDLFVKNSQKKRRGDLERTVVVLKRVVEKLQSENKKLHSAKVEQVHDKGYVEKLQIELQRSQENYLDAVDKISGLEIDLKEAKRDISGDNELGAVKAQLAQKCQLLSKIKVMLEMAVVREKALKEQVLDLQKLVPPEMLRGTYHELKR